MKRDITHFVKGQTLHSEEMDAIELSSADLATISGGGSCPGNNGFPSYSGNSYQGPYNYGRNSYQDPRYNYGGNSYQGPGSSYGGFPNGYGNEFNNTTPCQLPPPPCPYA